ncbi:SufE family protein [Maritalea porphyrae]|uniref:SufE family protein n=1 Tax=Maritalea porphyrae TaxID=880732 RepID=UPI0022B00B28|nr:SufE family protein [Maritalea porphyrae]MCZ4271176.1 SufE family protein [Maritalea porphyrae]
MNFDEIKESLSFLDDWEDRYKFVIDLGGELPSLADSEKTSANKVQGCVSQVWLVVDRHDDSSLVFRGDSDAMIVRGLVAIVVSLFSNKTPQAVIDTPAQEILEGLGLSEHLTSQRANGLRSMIDRVYAEARAHL